MKKRYSNGDNSVLAVQGVDFALERGEIVGLLGPNGAGKTTTIKCISSLITPTCGEIRVGGVSVLTSPKKALEETSAVLEGNRNIYWRLTPSENLEFFASLQGINPYGKNKKIRELLASFQLGEKINTPARKLSRGMQQKLALASALIQNPSLLLLDEPTLGLDVKASRDMRKKIKGLSSRENMTILLSSHDMDVVEEVCNRVVILESGKVVVDDKVNDLIDLFRAEGYKIVLDGQVTDEVKSVLGQDFNMTISTDSDGFRTEIEVELAEPEDIYDLLGRLKNQDLSIISLNRESPDFEEVFMNLVGGEKGEE